MKELSQSVQEYIDGGLKNYTCIIRQLTQHMSVEERVKTITLFSIETNRLLRERIGKEYKK